MHTFVLVFGSRLGIPSTPILYLLRYRPPALSFPSRILATAILKAHHRHPLNLLAVLRWIPWGHYSPCYSPRALPLFAVRARYRWYLGWVAHRMRLRVVWVIRLVGAAVVLRGAGCDRVSEAMFVRYMYVGRGGSSSRVASSLPWPPSWCCHHHPLTAGLLGGEEVATMRSWSLAAKGGIALT